MSSAEFWRLIDRLGIPDADALNLIAYPGKLPSSGKRPRFRLTIRQTRTARALAEVGTALEAVGETPAWRSRRHRSAPFSQGAHRWWSWLRAIIGVLRIGRYGKSRHAWGHMADQVQLDRNAWRDRAGKRTRIYLNGANLRGLTSTL